MIKIFYFFLIIIITYEQTIIPNLADPSSSSNNMYLPMKKDHKYGDDICYYREYDDKSQYYIYYVKPCEMGKYCAHEITDQPFGYCVDIQFNPATLSKWKEQCETKVNCQSGLTCDNSKCVKASTCSEFYQEDENTVTCLGINEKIDDKYCKRYEYSYLSNTNDIDTSKTITYYGNYPGLPYKCGLIHYKSHNYKYTDPSDGHLIDDVKYIEENYEWCTIGSVPDGEFVTDENYCYSGYTLEFYPNKLYENPSKNPSFSQTPQKLCVTPISIDIKNEQANDNCVITYKIGDGDTKLYNKQLGSGVSCSHTTIIESERHREFADAFKEASDEDKKNCYNLNENNYNYHCKNSKLIKLWYFKLHPEDYLFYKNREKLTKVLDFKIQMKFPTYAYTKYLKCSYLLFLLFLIIM